DARPRRARQGDARADHPHRAPAGHPRHRAGLGDRAAHGRPRGLSPRGAPPPPDAPTDIPALDGDRTRPRYSAQHDPGDLRPDDLERAENTPMTRPLSARRAPFTTRAVAAVTGIAVGLVLVFAATPATAAGPDTGFDQPYAGTPAFEKWAPTAAPSRQQVNRPLGQAQADQIARKLGLDKKRVFTEKQYVEFITGGGIGGDPHWAKLIDESVRIFTNT